MSADGVGLPVEWVHIRTGETYTLTGLSNLRAENREQWPVFAHYTGADGRRWTRTLASFLGSMRAGTGCLMGTESVPMEPEESPVVPEPDVAGLPEGWREVVPGRVWARGEGTVMVMVGGPADDDQPMFHVRVHGWCCSKPLGPLGVAIQVADKYYPVADYP